MRWPTSRTVNLFDLFIWAMFIMTFIIPMAILSTCYIRVIVVLWRHKRPGCTDIDDESRLRKTKVKTVRTLISIVILFAICWLPVNLYNLVLVTYNPDYLETHPLTTDVIRACTFIWPILSDSIFNPIVYVFLSDQCRRDLTTLYCHWRDDSPCNCKANKSHVRSLRSSRRKSARTETFMLHAR
ncbi:prolactin-releasing peptide receptor-like [Glandiceps talaboti]